MHEIAESLKIPESPVQRRSSIAREATETEERETEQTPDKAAILKRLVAQGARRVFPPGQAGPVSKPGTEISLAENEATESVESESDALPGWDSDHQAYLNRTQQMVDAVNNPAWYNLPQRVRNFRHGKWDLSQGRSRSGGREQDINLEEDVRTNMMISQMDPRLFNIKQHALNALNEARSKPVETAAGIIPIVGSAIKQRMSERTDVRERDLLRGVATTQSDAPILDTATSQAGALATKIKSGRVKAGISTVAGIAVPGAGNISTGVEKVANFAVDRLGSGANKQVIGMRAREQVRKDMRQSEFNNYESVDEYIALEKMREQLEKAGDGNEDSGAASVISPEMLRRLKAHTRGDIPHAKYMKQRAKEYEKEREREFRKGLEPQPKAEKTGILSKFKSFLRRSS